MREKVKEKTISAGFTIAFNKRACRYFRRWISYCNKRYRNFLPMLTILLITILLHNCWWHAYESNNYRNWLHCISFSFFVLVLWPLKVSVDSWSDYMQVYVQYLLKVFANLKEIIFTFNCNSRTTALSLFLPTLKMPKLLWANCPLIKKLHMKLLK